MAYASFNSSCKILEDLIYGGSNNDDSRAQTERNADIQVNKFVLACRQFQKGMANFSILKAQYTNRELLSNDFDSAIDSRLPTSADFGESDQLVRGPYSGRDKEDIDADFDKMLSERHTNEAHAKRSGSHGHRLNDQQLG